MSDPHITIALTFRTSAPSAAVLEGVIAALNRHAMPYELAAASCSTYDLDEVDDQ
ncbi:hypothetical protein FHS43_006199 [Streptosporangium becharense]|uniref:Uncharacterized protein n=1 Tax=Streptosporangium becharense TaxID=1816182 RepID=A0A7W9MGM8_9ACTN|nr:hypothetical protein [Streptosporangium becharense]MBB2914887.1 hypothetical protein [Streptosporangium becharense]MBB5820302.1 hypothetical protein [Streptosporangium becharense]